MLKKTINITDLNGVNKNVTMYFNLNTIEMAEIGDRYHKGSMELDEYFQSLVANNNPYKIITTIADIVLCAYGKRSEDGATFIKTPELTAQFKNSTEYADYVEAIIFDETAATEFSMNVLSSKRMKAAAEEKAKELNIELPVAEKSGLRVLEEQVAETDPTANMTPEMKAQFEAYLKNQNK